MSKYILLAVLLVLSFPLSLIGCRTQEQGEAAVQDSVEYNGVQSTVDGRQIRNAVGPPLVEEASDAGCPEYQCIEAATDNELEALHENKSSETLLGIHPEPLPFEDEIAPEVQEAQSVKLVIPEKKVKQSKKLKRASRRKKPRRARRIKYAKRSKRSRRTKRKKSAEQIKKAKRREITKRIKISMADPNEACPGVFWASVIRVHDGDTIDVMDGDRGWRIRLFGVDTPEKRQEYGQEAKKFAQHLLGNRVVEVHPETIGPYGRLVANIRLPGGVRLGRTLVKAGYAWWYRRFVHVYDAPEEGESVSEGITLRDLEDEARQSRRGLWAAEEPTAPWKWRAREKRRRKKLLRAKLGSKSSRRKRKRSKSSTKKPSKRKRRRRRRERKVG